MASNSPVTTSGTASTKAVPGQKQQQQSTSQLISSYVLDDLSSRFIINVPVQERQDLIRICFQIELAHWFYLDFYCSERNQKCGIKQFAFQLFKHIPFLSQYLESVDLILEEWKLYKLTVPTYGAILISEDLKHVLLVQSFFAKSSWGFPKGKINENEDPLHCAIREVYEETGYDIKNLIVPTEFIELVVNYQFTRLYLVCGVPLSTVFTPKTRNEIKSCEWFPIELLPVKKNDNFVKDKLSMNGNSFFMVLPFIKRLKTWLERLPKNKHKAYINNSPVFGSASKQNKYFEKAGSAGNNSASRQRQRHKSLGDIEQQQRSKSSGSQLVKNTPNAHLFNEGILEQQVGTAVNSASNKKSNRKNFGQEGTTPAGIQILGAGDSAKSHIKRKLFDALEKDDDNNKPSSSKDLSTLFVENNAWLSFKLDYSKFL